MTRLALLVIVIFRLRLNSGQYSVFAWVGGTVCMLLYVTHVARAMRGQCLGELMYKHARQIVWAISTSSIPNTEGQQKYTKAKTHHSPSQRNRAGDEVRHKSIKF